jgi:hypothetical protein
MRRALFARLARLEARPQAAKPAILRYGWVKPLPDDYIGEKHTVIVKRELTGQPNIEWCQFEERRGQPPAGRVDGPFVVGLTPA